jgi:hypothetical protein
MLTNTLTQLKLNYKLSQPVLPMSYALHEFAASTAMIKHP